MNRVTTVTTGDVKRDYDVLGPVYFQVSNKGVFSSALSKLVKQYAAEIAEAKKQGQVGAGRNDWGFLYRRVQRRADRLREGVFCRR